MRVINYKINLLSMEVKTLIRQNKMTVYCTFFSSLHQDHLLPPFFILADHLAPAPCNWPLCIWRRTGPVTATWLGCRDELFLMLKW